MIVKLVSKYRRSLSMVTASVLALSMSSAAVAENFEKALPGDALVVFNFKNVALMQKQAANTSGGKLMKDPAMQPFMAGINAELNKIKAKIEGEAGISIDEALASFTGQVTVSISLTKKDGRPEPVLYLLADVAGKESSIKKVLEVAGKKFEKHGMTKRSSGDLTVYGSGDKTVCFGVKGGVLYVGTNEAALSNVINTGASRSDALADNSRFKQFRESAGGIGGVEAYLDIHRAMSMVDASNPASLGMNMFGMGVFQCAGMSMSFEKDDFESLTQLIVLKNGNGALWNMMMMPVKAVKPEAWVPGNVSSYSTVNWDFDLFVSTVLGLLSQVPTFNLEQGNEMLKVIEPNKPFDIKKDILDPLGNRISFIGDFTDVKGKPVGRSLVAWQLDSSESLSRFVDTVIGFINGLGQVQFDKKSIKGTTVHTLDVGGLIKNLGQANDMGDVFGVLGIGVTKSHLFIATHVELLEKVLNSDGSSPLSESPQFRKIAAKFPSQTSGLNFHSAEGSYLAAKSMVLQARQSMEGIKNMPTGGDDEVMKLLEGLVGAVDVAKFPEYEKIKQHLAPTGGYGVMTENSLKWVFFNLKQ